MHLWTRVSIGSLLAVAAASGGWLALHRKDVTPKPLREANQHLSAEELHGPPDSEQVTEPEPAFVTNEAVDYSSVPAPYIEKVTPEQSAKLAIIVEEWLRDDGRIPVSYRRGLVYVESTEDRGDEGPYPRSAEPEAIHACGSQALWLRTYIQSSSASSTKSHARRTSARTAGWSTRRTAT